MAVNDRRARVCGSHERHAQIRRVVADELRLLTYPVAVGDGLRLLADGLQARFELAQTRVFPTGVVLTIHRLTTDG